MSALKTKRTGYLLALAVFIALALTVVAVLVLLPLEYMRNQIESQAVDDGGCTIDAKPLGPSSFAFEITEPEDVTASSTEWDFGDGTEIVEEGSVSSSHTFEEPGTYAIEANAWRDEDIVRNCQTTVSIAN